MVNPLPAKDKDQDKLYPETRYFAHRISQCGHQPVYKQLLPDGEQVVLSPTPSQKVYDHSPGFGWGYGGSGPAQLALALLLDVTLHPNLALAYYQQFKWDRIAELGDEWEMTRSGILAWISRQEIREFGARVSKN